MQSRLKQHSEFVSCSDLSSAARISTRHICTHSHILTCRSHEARNDTLGCQDRQAEVRTLAAAVMPRLIASLRVFSLLYVRVCVCEILSRRVVYVVSFTPSVCRRDDSMWDRMHVWICDSPLVLTFEDILTWSQQPTAHILVYTHT